MPETPADQMNDLNASAIPQPLVTHIYIADPSAHVFEGKLYIYPSHDIVNDIPHDDLGSQYAMEDYHVFRMDSPDSAAEDCGQALHVRDVPWADKQMWAPDAAEKDGIYYLYFPAKRPDGIFQIGVAVSGRPEGPFTPQPLPIPGSYSIDPAVFKDDDGQYFMYFGGIWGGQLQNYRANRYAPDHGLPADNEPALGPRVALLTGDMRSFAEEVREITILDESGAPLLAGDSDRRFFEAAWMHRYRDTYYFSYSTGDTHYLCYATGDSPYGPFTYRGQILTPVIGWTTHHSICAFGDRWYLFYHDASLSGGQSHLRSVKMTELLYDDKGRIITLHPYGDSSINQLTEH